MKVLVVVDLQTDFTFGALGNAECVEVVEKVAKLISEEDYDEVVFTRDTHQKNYLETQEGRNLPVVHCLEETDGWQIREELMLAVKGKNYIIFDKPTFGSITLAEHLRKLYEENNGDVEVEFVGVCTGICVISNALLTKAFVPEMKITVKAKYCACVTPESHRTSLEAMKLCQIYIEED